MSTITRERLEQYANDPRMCNVNDEIRQMARIALASLEAEPVVWRYRHHNGLAPSIWKYVDSAEECKSAANYQCQALYAAPKSLTTAEQAELQKFRRESQAQQDVVAERQRQIKSEGCTPEQDDHYTDGELAAAACCYAYHGFSRQWLFNQDAENYRAYAHNSYWPWKESWWKPKSPRQDLVRATALLLAEIERLDRQAAHREATK